MSKKDIQAAKSDGCAYSARSSDDAETCAFRIAVETAIRKNQANGYPIARYDAEKRRAYLEYPDRSREYAKQRGEKARDHRFLAKGNCVSVAKKEAIL